MAVILFLVLLQGAQGVQLDEQFTAEQQIFRVIVKRDALDNILKDDPKSKCRNGGIFAGGQCHCIHPHVGPTCQDFACLNGGISVGRRFDPNSLFFSKPCICNDGYRGDLCEYHPTEKCNKRGEWKHGHCECVGSWFGDECQYTSRCDFGVIKHGRCICHKHFQGDYCERAVCYHGYHNVANHSRSCVCPAKYKGDHCDQCAQVGKHILPYPQCVVDFVPHERHMRKKAKHQNKSRIFIIVGAVIFLLTILVIMVILHVMHQKKKNPQEEEMRLRTLHERQMMLQSAALREDEPESAQNTITKLKREKRRSLPNIFKFKRSNSSDRFLRVRDQADDRQSLPRESAEI